MKWNKSDIAIACGIVGLIVFGHVAVIKTYARTAIAGKLLAQGSGSAYEAPGAEKAGQMESQAELVLASLGSIEIDYSAQKNTIEYGYISDLIGAGLLTPNTKGATLTPGYSITIYLHPMKNGFTAIAEPVQPELRTLLFDENQKVVRVVPTLADDPDATWTLVENNMQSGYSQTGRYQPPFLLEMGTHVPPLQVRLSQDGKKYILLQATGEAGQYVPDNSLIYSSYFNTYLTGDLREFAE